MIDSIKNWIINIGCTIFFITAVEMILPNNSMKKYAKFVLGLVLITVLIGPILKLFYGDFSNSAYANEILDQIQTGNISGNIEKYQEVNIQNTLKTFEDNLKLSCEKILKEKFTQYNFVAEIVAEYDKQSSEFHIKNISIKTNYRNFDEIRTFLSKEFSVSEDNIKVLGTK